MSAKWRSAILVIAGVGCIVAAIFGWLVYDKTLVDIAIPIGLSIGGVMVTSPISCKLWRWLTGSDNRWHNMACNLAVTGSVVFAAFLSANFYLADQSSGYTENITIENKWRKTHDTYQRIRRHSYRKTGVRYTYHMDVRFSSGFRKEMQIQRPAYNRYKTGGTYTFTMQRGLFGFPVIKDLN